MHYFCVIKEKEVSDDFAICYHPYKSVTTCQVSKALLMYIAKVRKFLFRFKSIHRLIQSMKWRTLYHTMSSSRDQCTLRYILVFLLSIYWNIISHNLHTNKNVNKIQYYRLIFESFIYKVQPVMDKKMTYACKFLCKFVAFHQQRQDKNWKSFLMLTFCFKGPINTYFISRNSVNSPQITSLFSIDFSINSAHFTSQYH